VPRGLAVASAVTLRVCIVVGGLVLLGLGAARMMLVLLPFLVAVLMTTLLVVPAGWLRAHRWRPAPAAMAATLLACSCSPACGR
jgi:putative heme transporter